MPVGIVQSLPCVAMVPLMDTSCQVCATLEGILCTIPFVWKLCSDANATLSVCSAVLVETLRVVVWIIFLANLLCTCCVFPEPGISSCLNCGVQYTAVCARNPSTCDSNNSACYTVDLACRQSTGMLGLHSLLQCPTLHSRCVLL